MARNKPNSLITITNAGLTTTVSTIDNVDVYEIKASGGSVVLAGNVSITASGTPDRGTTFSFIKTAGFTLGAFTFSVFGTTLTAAQCLYKVKIFCYYNGTTWDVFVDDDDTSGQVSVNGANIVASTISATALSGNIALSQLATGAARGYAIRAGQNGTWQAFNAVTAGNILIGNGTDLTSTAVTGDVTISSAGVTTIGAGKVTADMLAYTPQEYFEESLTIATASVLTLNGTPITIVAAPGAGKYIEVVSASASLTFVSAAYATNTTLQLINEGATIAQLQNTSILISTVSKNTKFTDVTPPTAGQTQIITNTALQVKIATGNPTAGDSNVIIKVIYRIVTI